MDAALLRASSGRERPRRRTTHSSSREVRWLTERMLMSSVGVIVILGCESGVVWGDMGERGRS